MLLFWSLVDRLQDIFKGERPWQAAQPAAKDAWLAAMRERLRVYDQHVLKELQALVAEYEEKTLAVTDFGAFELWSSLPAGVAVGAPSPPAVDG